MQSETTHTSSINVVKCFFLTKKKYIYGNICMVYMINTSLFLLGFPSLSGFFFPK